MTAEYIARQPGAWLPGVRSDSCGCRTAAACGPCRDGRHDACDDGQHSGIHHGSAGLVRGLSAAHSLYLYETRYPHHVCCQCARDGHPAAPPPPEPDDDMGTPSLLEGLLT